MARDLTPDPTPAPPAGGDATPTCRYCRGEGRVYAMGDGDFVDCPDCDGKGSPPVPAGEAREDEELFAMKGRGAAAIKAHFDARATTPQEFVVFLPADWEAIRARLATAEQAAARAERERDELRAWKAGVQAGADVLPPGEHEHCATLDEVASQVICRVLDAEATPRFHEWYEREGRLAFVWWGRALGAWLGGEVRANRESALAAARAEGARLKDWMRRMGHHFGCTANAGLECTCGLTATLSPPERTA
jgi:hypothetical protein